MIIKRIIALTMLLLVAACGQKGALILTPPPPEQPQKTLEVEQTPVNQKDSEQQSDIPPSEGSDQ